MYVTTGGSRLSQMFWEHENQYWLISNLAYLPLNYTGKRKPNFGKKNLG